MRSELAPSPRGPSSLWWGHTHWEGQGRRMVPEKFRPPEFPGNFCHGNAPYLIFIPWPQFKVPQQKTNDQWHSKGIAIAIPFLESFWCPLTFAVAVSSVVGGNQLDNSLWCSLVSPLVPYFCAVFTFVRCTQTLYSYTLFCVCWKEEIKLKS